MGKAFQWGIIAPGNIAGRFAESFKVIDQAEILTVGSRSLNRAREFAGKWGIPQAVGSYREVADNPGVDAVYIAAPHRYHAELIEMALNAGKPVLCEKPITVNAGELKELILLAEKKGLFLMEAMWMRHLPIMQTLKKEWLAEGRLGKIKRIEADFSFEAPQDPQGRLFNPELAGGALLDAGIYPLTLAYWLVGCKPDRITSLHTMGETGVDTQAGIMMHWRSGELAVLTTGIDTRGSIRAAVLGTEGMVEISRPFFGSQSMTFRNDQGESTTAIPHEATGFEYEIREAMRCIRQGFQESPEHSWSETIEMMEIMDELRAEWKFRYPFEPKIRIH